MSKKTTETTAAPEGEVKTFLSLTDLKPAKGSVKAKLRVGRGRASGAGKTANRGHNGEGQRSGRSRKRGFEGGQMPGYRRMPKINGFELVNPRQWLELNVEDLEQILLPEENELTYDLLLTGGLMKIKHDGIRVLGKGEVKRKITVEAHYVTPSARQKIEAAGGSIRLIGPAEAAEA
ncbi:50S ribosomal protein L15 [Vampirovibrio sp.]|uniref:50S ribosomal protein L15 n=1 Tax=Vampirovibrio sp. TaxID=2717857 RepID=UPI003593889E